MGHPYTMPENLRKHLERTALAEKAWVALITSGIQLNDLDLASQAFQYADAFIEIRDKEHPDGDKTK